MRDHELVEACKKKNRQAQKHLYERFAGQMMAVCMRYGGNRDTAEDMLQEGFITVFEKLWQYTGEGALGGWIRRVMVTTCLEYLRKNKKHQFTEDIEQQEGTSDLSAGVLSDMGFEELLKMISELPPGYRTVFNLFAVEGYSHKEIAELLGITESTSKTQFFKAKAQLRQQIEKTNYASERSGNTTRTQ